MTTTNNESELAAKWAALASANRLLHAAVKNRDIDIVSARKSAAMRAYRAFWDTAGADDYAAKVSN